MEIAVKPTIGPDNYYSVKNMLLSNDEATINVAVSLMETVEYEESELYLLMLLKESFDIVFKNELKLKEKAPELYKNLEQSKNVMDMTHISLKEIYNIATTSNNEVAQLFILDAIRDTLVEMLRELKYDFVDFTELYIKPAGWGEKNNMKK